MRLRGNIMILTVPTFVALWFVIAYALMYLTPDPTQFGIYRPRHDWLFVHVITGTIALLVGPTQLWLGLNRWTGIPHRILGITYVAGVTASSVAAFYLARHTDFGWVFGLGFGTMASAWLITTALGTIAICLRRVEQHREWMIRSYVITFAFVTFRALQAGFDIAKLGNTMVERMGGAVWLAWTAPLMITEVILQARKIFITPVTVMRLPETNAYTVVPEPQVYDLQNSESTYQHQR
jgi:uncharacterized membrane protein